MTSGTTAILLADERIPSREDRNDRRRRSGRVQHPDPGQDHDPGSGRDPDRDARVHRRVPDRRRPPSRCTTTSTSSAAVEVFLNCVPAASLEAMRIGMAELGVDACHQVGDRRRPARLELAVPHRQHRHRLRVGHPRPGRDGPTVVEIPPGCGPGTVNDAWFRFVIDMGRPGPDRGEGGKYLIVPTGYDGPDPRRLLRRRVAVERSMVDPPRPARRRQARHRPTENFHDGLRDLPAVPGRRAAGDGVHRRCRAGSSTPSTPTTPSSTTRSPRSSNANRVDVIDPETRGLLAAIGIKKGTPFAPDDRMQAILTDAAAVANGTARAIAFKTRDPEAILFADRAWKTGFVGGDYRWLIDDGVGGRNLDARTLFFYVATVNTPAMALKMPGVGSQYALVEHDSNGEYLDGAKQLPAHAPADVPGQGLLVRRRLRPPDPVRAPDRPAVPQPQQPARPTRRTTTTARSPSPSGPTSPTTKRRTGSRPFPARSGSPSCASTDPSSPGSTAPGSPATSNPPSHPSFRDDGSWPLPASAAAGGRGPSHAGFVVDVG